MQLHSLNLASMNENLKLVLSPITPALLIYHVGFLKDLF